MWFANLGKVASGSITQGLKLRDRKVGSQVSSKDRSRFPGRGTIGKVRRGGRRASNRAKKRVYRFRVRFEQERRASRLPCLSLGLGDDRRSTSGSGQVSLAIFIIFVSGSERLLLSLTSSSTLVDHQALGWYLMRPKGMKDLAAFSVREVKKAAAAEGEKESVLPSVREERIEGAYTLRNEREKELFREMLTPT